MGMQLTLVIVWMIITANSKMDGTIL